jgi:hypothetical protein
MKGQAMRAQLRLLVLSSAITALVASTSIKAASISVQMGDPQKPGAVSSIWRSPTGGVVHDFEIPVQSSMTSSDLAVATLHALHGVPGVDPASATVVGDQVNVNSTPLLDSLDGVLPGGSIYWSTGTTAQDSVRLSSPDISHATIEAAGHFEPFYQPFQPAIFTAGIVTDVGVLSTNISSQELNFQTDGPIICQALFQRLAPRAPQYGAQINYAGDRLEIYFDPAYTVTQGGIIFGTTSPSQGYSGTITTPPILPPIPLPGDYNGDSTVDGADYPWWRKKVGTTDSLSNDLIGGIIGAAHYDQWRSNFGQRANLGLVADPNTIVPEPGTFLLCSWAAAAAVLRRRVAPQVPSGH